ncbi:MULTISPECIES: sulfur carrier protein ThiS [Bacillaceae]|uniref:sulfur carrier protein ThiS n=1 Tax=Bacillaceae TaxID=186817 RepID=UPI001BDF5E83|nr:MULTISPECIES: sulfur carrier protein ThiS [Bacillaceae]MDX8364740.1 sulfur carrier protein ThiS [Cytobacillus sp. IB215665]
MKLFINGDRVDVPDTLENISDVLAHFELEDNIVIVEINSTILQKQDHKDTQVNDNDRIEIVHFVGGG